MNPHNPSTPDVTPSPAEAPPAKKNRQKSPAGFLTLIRWLLGAQLPALWGFELNKEPYVPGIHYRMLGKNWKGPVYFTAAHHHRDLHYVTAQIRSLVRANAPLPRGLEAVAREERRTGTGYAFAKAFVLTTAFSLGALSVYLFLMRSDLQAMVLGVFMLATLFIGLTIFASTQGQTKMALLFFAGMSISIVAFYAIGYIHDWQLERWVRRGFLRADPADVTMVLFIAVVMACFALNYRAARKNSARELVLVRLRDLLESGHALSEAMRRMPRFFPRFYADMVETGEETGRMEACLAELNEELGSDMAVQRQIRGALLYLGTICVVQIVLMSFVMIRIVPVFAEIYSEFGSSPTWPFLRMLIHLADRVWMSVPQLQAGINALLMGTFSMTNLGDLLAAATPVLIVVAVPSLLLWRTLRRRRRGFSSRLMSSLFLLLPGFRGMIMQDNFTVITGMLEKMLRAGVPMDTAMTKVCAGDINPVYARMLRRVHKRILDGESLGAAFDSESSDILTPASFSCLVAVGEQSGMLPEALAYLHSFYRSQSEIRARILVDTIKPFGVIIIGLFVLMFMKDMFAMLTGIIDSILNSM